MRISAMLSQARAHVTVEIEELDRDGLLYNCAMEQSIYVRGN